MSILNVPFRIQLDTLRTIAMKLRDNAKVFHKNKNTMVDYYGKPISQLYIDMMETELNAGMNWVEKTVTLINDTIGIPGESEKQIDIWKQMDIKETIHLYLKNAADCLDRSGAIAKEAENKPLLCIIL